MDISPGYATASGNLSSQGPSYYIEAFEHIVGPADARLVIHLVSAWAILQRWVASRSYVWTAGARTIRQIAQFICARAGFAFAVQGASPDSIDLLPPFTVNPYAWPYRLAASWPAWAWELWLRSNRDRPPPPTITIRAGQTALQALQSLLDRVPDRPFINGATITIKDVPASEASAYSYGSGHAITVARYRRALKEAAHVQVFAGPSASILGEAIDYVTLDLRYGSALQLSDSYLSTEAQADARASKEDRHLTIDSRDDAIVVPVNCGQELWDVIDVSEARLDLSAAKRRVTALRLRLRRDPPSYDHILTLGEP